MTYTRSQSYTNMMVGKHGIQMFKVVFLVVLLLLMFFDVFAPTHAHPLLFSDKCPYVHKCQLLSFHAIVPQ